MGGDSSPNGDIDSLGLRAGGVTAMCLTPLTVKGRD